MEPQIALNHGAAPDPAHRLATIKPGGLYAVLTYRGELASWDWAFFVPDPNAAPIGSSGTKFHVQETTDLGPATSITTTTTTIIAASSGNGTAPTIIASGVGGGVSGGGAGGGNGASSSSSISGPVSVEWRFEAESGKDVASSLLVVALIRLADVSFLGEYKDVVGEDGLLPMFKSVKIPGRVATRSNAEGGGAAGGQGGGAGAGTERVTAPPQEFSSRIWFLDAICMLHDCGVVTCDDVWLLEREIRRYAFTAMDRYLGNIGMFVLSSRFLSLSINISSICVRWC